MHFDQNLGESIVSTFWNIVRKSKDNGTSPLDLLVMAMRDTLHPEARAERTYPPAACFPMSPKEKEMFSEVLKSAQFPYFVYLWACTCQR